MHNTLPRVHTLVKVCLRMGICPNLSIHAAVCLQINRPPAKLNLLTCQVRPNPEDRRTFDLVTRKLIPGVWPRALNAPRVINKDSPQSSAVQLCGSLPICFPNQYKSQSDIWTNARVHSFYVLWCWTREAMRCVRFEFMLCILLTVNPPPDPSCWATYSVKTLCWAFSLSTDNRTYHFQAEDEQECVR